MNEASGEKHKSYYHQDNRVGILQFQYRNQDDK